MNDSRNGNFTSSGIGALMSPAKTKGALSAPALNYIAEKNMERRLGRSLTDEITSRPTSWGNLVEGKGFNLLGTEYKLCSRETKDHPTIDCWKGSPDGQKFDPGNTVFDLKCPFTLKSFCQLVDGWKDGGVTGLRDAHKEGENYYWQLVSNAILTKSKHAELIVYVPYRSELESIRDMAHTFDGEKQGRFSWIAWASDDDLPCLVDGGYYKNINVMRFLVPVEDKIALHERIVECAKKLDPKPEMITV